MKTIIAGSRSIHPGVGLLLIRKAVEACGWEVTEVISGCARGIDRFGEEWASSRGLPVRRYPADWDNQGKAAGVMRNRQMAEAAEALVAIWNGKSPGTKNMIEQATKKGLRVYVYRTDQLQEGQ